MRHRENTAKELQWLHTFSIETAKNAPEACIPRHIHFVQGAPINIPYFTAICERGYINSMS